MTKEQVIKMLLKQTGLGLPGAIRVWKELSRDGFYEVERKEVQDYIRKNW